MGLRNRKSEKYNARMIEILQLEGRASKDHTFFCKEILPIGSNLARLTKHLVLPDRIFSLCEFQGELDVSARAQEELRIWQKSSQHEKHDYSMKSLT